MSALFLVSAAALVDRCYCTGYIWKPFGQIPPESPPPPPPPPPQEKPGCPGENAPKKGKGKPDDRTERDVTNEPFLGFPPSPFSGFPTNQKIPISSAFYQGLKGGPLAGYQIQQVPDKGATPVAVLTNIGPPAPPVPPPKSYPVLSKGGALKGWRVAPLARPIILQQITVPNVRVKSKSFQAVTPKGAIVIQSTPSIFNVSSKGGLSYITI